MIQKESVDYQPMAFRCFRRLLRCDTTFLSLVALGIVTLVSLPMHAEAASVTGKVYSDSGGTVPLASVTVRVSLNANAGTTATTDNGGQFSVTGLTLTGGTIITMFIDGSTIHKAVTVSLGSGSSMTGFTLIKNALIVKSGTGASYSPVITSHHLSIAGLSNSTDTDITAIFTRSGDNITVPIFKKLVIWNTGSILSMSGTLTVARMHIRYGTFRPGSNKMTVSLAMTMSGGTFSGGDQTIRMSAATFFTIWGGTFTSTSSGMILGNTAYIHTNGGTFNHNNGTVEWNMGVSASADVRTTETFYNLNVVANAANRFFTIASGDTFVVNNTLNWASGSIDAGTVDVKGDVIVGTTAGGQFSSASLLRLIGTGTQTCTLNAGGAVSKMTINNAAATCTVTGAGTFTMESDFTLANGTFNGGSTDLSFTANLAPFVISGGTFNATTGTMQMNSNSWTHTAGGTFNALTGTVAWNSTQVNGTTLDVATIEDFNNFTMAANATSRELNIASGDTVEVNGTFTWTSGAIDIGTVDAKGDVVIGAAAGGQDITPSTLRLVGTGTQTCTLAAGGAVSAMIINNASATCTVSGVGTFTHERAFTLLDGAFDGGSTNITFTTNVSPFTIAGGTYTATSGTMSMAQNNWTHTAGGTFLHNNGTVIWANNTNTMTIDILGVETFFNLTINGNGSASQEIIATGDVLIIAGDFSWGQTAIDGGTIDAKGGVRISGAAGGRTTTVNILRLSGTTAQACTLIGTGRVSTLVLANPLAVCTGTGSSTFVAEDNLLMTGGTLNLNGSSMTVTSNWTIGTGTTLRLLGGETLTGGPDFIHARSNFWYSDSAKTIVLKALNYQNLIISSTGSAIFRPKTVGQSIKGDLILSGATLQINGGQPLSVSGSWIQTGGTFTAGTGTVTLAGADTTETLKATSSFNNLTLNNGLIAYWKMDEGTGSTLAKDLSGKGNNGTLTNGPTWNTSVPGRIQFYDPKSLSFDGVNDYVTKSSFVGGNSFQGSASFWLYYRNSVSNTGFLTASTQAMLLFDNGGFMRVGVYDANNVVASLDINDPSTIPLNQWVHYALTYNTSGGRLYRNGVEVAQDATGTGAYRTLNASTIYIGSDRNIASRYVNGMMDDVRLYNYALSSSEITALYNGNQSTGSGTYVLDSALTVAGSLTIQSGTLDVSGSNLGVTVTGNMLNAGGFMAQAGTVTFNGSGNQTLSGTTIFNNLTMTTAAARTLFLDYTGKQSVSGALILRGVAGNLLSIRSTKTGSGAGILLDGTSGTQTIDYLNVKDSNASGGSTLVCLTATEGCVDSGNNTNWTFVPAATYSLTGKVYSNTGATTPLTGVTVAASFNGAAAVGSAAVDAGGQFSITGLATSSLTGGTIVTLYIDGATQKAVTVSTGSGGSMTGMTLIQNNLIVRSGTGTHVRIGSPVTSSILDTANNNGDTDITALYTNSSQNITVVTGKRLYVWTGSSLNLGGTLTTGYMHINGNVSQGANAVTVNNNLTMSGGTFTGGSSTIDDNGSFTLGGGTFTSTTGNFQVATEWVHTAAGTFAANSGTVILDSGAASTIDVNVVETFYNFQFNRPNVASTLASGDTLLVLGTLNPVNGYLNGGTLEARGDISMNLNYDGGSTALLLTGTANQQFDDFDVAYQGDFTINKSSGTVTTSTDVNLDGNVSLLSGTFVAPSGTLSLSKNWNHAGGTFTHNNGTVNLDSVLGNQTLSGSTLFNNLSANSAFPRTIFFDYTARQSVSGSLVLQGTIGNILKIRSTKTGTQARLLLDGDSTQNASDFEYLDVKDSDASGGQALVCLTATEGCIDSGNNTNWTFVAAVTYSITGKVFSNTGATTPLTGVTIAASFNGAAAVGSAAVDAGGQFSITGISTSSLTGGTIVTLYIDGATQKAVTVSTGSGGSMTGMTLIQNNLIVRSGTGTHVRIGSPVTSSILDTANNNGDTDITALYTNSSQNITVVTGKRLYVWTGSSLNLGGTLTTGYMHINGNVSQGANAITVNNNLTMSGGTFTGGSSTIDDNGSFTLGGGTFISTTSNFQVASDWYHTGAGTFSHNNGTLVWDTNSGIIDVNGTETFNNMSINVNGITKTIATGDTLVIAGLASLTNGLMSGGTMDVRGDVSIAVGYDAGRASSLLLTGTANQSFTATNTLNTYSGSLTINKASGTVTGSGTISVGPFTLTSGTLVSTPGIFTVAGDWTHTAGGTFLHNSGSVVLGSTVASTVDVIGSETFYNLQFLPSNNIPVTIGSNDTLITLGLLYFRDGVTNGGLVEARGNTLITGAYDAGGTTPVIFTGNIDQTFTDTSAGDRPAGTRTVNKSGGKLIMASDMIMNAAGQDFFLSGGTLDLNGYNIRANDQFIVGTGTTLRLEGGETLTGGPDFIGLNATVWYHAPAGTKTLKALNYQNVVISSTGSAVFRLKTVGQSIGNNLFLSGGTLEVNGGQPLSVSGAWVQTGGTFTAGTGTVLLAGTGTTQTLKATSSFNNLTLNNGLIAYWKMDEGTGATIAKDLSGNGNNGTLTNGPTWNTSTPGNIQFNDPQSLHFDGINDYVAKSSFVGGSSTQGTASFWLYYRASVHANGFLTASSLAPLIIDSGGHARAQIYNAAGVAASVDMIDPSLITLNQWTFFTFTYDANGGVLYRDGAKVQQDTTGTGAYRSLNGTTVFIGSDRTLAGRYINGMLDDVRLYNRALSSSEVTALYNGNQSTGSGTYVLGSALTVAGNLNIISGTLDVSGSSYGVTITGNMLNAGGFTKQAGTVTFDGSGNQTISGSTVFNNFTATTTSARTIFFDYTGRQSASGSLTLHGVSGNKLSIRSTKTGSGARILLDGDATQLSTDFAQLDVKDSNASGGQALICFTSTEGCTDSGNNTNWTFTSGAPSYSITGKVYTNTGATTPMTGVTVGVSLNAGTATTVAVDAGGQFTVTPSLLTGGTLITLFIDGGSAAQKAVTVSLGSGSTMTGFVLIKDTLIARSGTGASYSPVLTSRHLAIAKLSNSSDSDISALFSTSSNDVTVATGKRLALWNTGSVLSMSGTLTTPRLHMRYGTFRQGSNKMTISTALTQSGGTFGGGTQTIFMSGNPGFLSIGGGTFTATSSGILIPRNTFTYNGGTFNHNNGTIIFNGGAGLNSTFVVPNGISLNNLTINGGGVTAGLNVTAGQTVTTVGTLSLLAGAFDSGTINAQGPIIHASTFGGSSVALDGTIALTTGSQTVNLATGMFPGLYVNAPGVTVNMPATGSIEFGSGVTLDSGTIDGKGSDMLLDSALNSQSALTITNGTFIAPSSTLTIAAPANFITNIIISGGTFNHNNGTLILDDRSAATSQVVANLSGNPLFNNVSIFGKSTNALNLTAGQKMHVNGRTIFHSGQINTGTLDMKGDLLIGSGAAGGSTAFLFTGTGTQILSNTGGTVTTGTWTVAKPRGVLTLSGGALTLNTSGQDLFLTGGTLSLNGNNLTVNDIFTVGTGTTLRLHGSETLSGGPDFLHRNSTVWYDASAGTNILKTLNYQNIVISSTGSGIFRPKTVGQSIGNNLFISGGTLQVNGGQPLSVSGAWVQTGGTFTAGTGTVLLAGTGTTQRLTASSSFNNVRLNNGLLGYWRLDEGTGATIAKDVSGNGNNGTLTNGPSWSTVTPGRIQFYDPKSLSFDGTDDYITTGAATNSALKPTTFPVAFSVWVNIASLATQRSIVSLGGNSSTDAHTGIEVHVNTNGSTGIQAGFGSPSGPTARRNLDTPAGVITTGSWFHIYALMTSSTTGEIWVNGVSQSLTPSGTGVGTISYLGYDGMWIGRYGTASAPARVNFNGKIDELRVYNRALSSGEITSLYAGNQATGSGTYVLGSALTVAGNLTIQSGTLDASASNYDVNVAGNFANYSGFTKRSASVIFNGSGNQTLSGATVFNTLSATSATARTLFFDYTGRQSASGSLVLHGIAGNLISIRSTKTGSGAHILLDADATQNITDLQYLNVKDSDASGGQALNCASSSEGCVDSGNNINWVFTGGTPSRSYFFFLGF